MATVLLEPLSRTLFQFPPGTEPQAIPPPRSTLLVPFAIPDDLYRTALDWKVPLTVASLYAVTAKLLNIYNRSTGKQAWAISKSKTFHALVVLHNVFLAVYSAWTFRGMLTALRNSIVSPTGPNGLAGTVDSFCKLNGPGGLGQAIAYDQASHRWVTATGDSPLTVGGAPSRLDTGRLWNEGLAFYGWIFYLSKFYEVMDTFIILAKGKLSSTLQTYHHAGAMMCMWAGMRYMSAPIWMFVFVNSGIHAMMYTYYTITAFNIRVPTAIKRTLTTLQITQFLVGASYAMLHSFVYYTVPVQVPISKTAKVVASVASAATSTTWSDPPATGILHSLKAMLLGTAEAANAAAVVHPPAQERAGHEVQYRKVPCVTTTGATFAIWLNVLYLAPLTYLFVSFFIASYLKRSNAEAERARAEKQYSGEDRRLSNAVLAAEKAGWDAARGIEKEVYGQGDSAIIDEDDVEAYAATGRDARALRSRSNKVLSDVKKGQGGG